MILRVIKMVSFLLDSDIESSILEENENLGKLVETFVYSELIKHQSYSEENIEIYHFRDVKQKK